LYNFQIAETKNFKKCIAKIDKNVYTKIINIVYPQLRKNPFYGTNIKKLKEQLTGYYRYRLGNYRLFYLLDGDDILIIVTDFKHRQSAYE